MSDFSDQSKKGDIEQWSEMRDADAKWRILCQINTLIYRARWFGDESTGYCHLCDRFIRTGRKVAANGAVLHPDMVHYLEVHNLCPPTNVIEALETHYNRWLRDETERTEDAMARMQDK